MTPQELTDHMRALVARADYADADSLLSGHGWMLWAHLTDAERQEIDGLAQLVQVGRDALVAATPTALARDECAGS